MIIHNKVLFDATVCGIVLFNNFFTYFMLVYRNAIDFCKLILYPVTLLNLWTSSDKFLVESLEFSVYRMTASANRENLILPFQLLWLFSCLLSLITTYSIMLNATCVSGHPCFFLSLEENFSTCQH